jgi:hypothetical protein
MKKNPRGIMFPVKSPFSGVSAGLSLVEIVISVAVLLMLVVAASRIVQRNARMIDASRQNTAAAAIFQMMENRIKGMPFHDVFWFDSSNKTYIGSPPYLFQPWSINTSSHTLLYMESEAFKRGFPRIRIESVYMRRDSSDMANNNRILEDSVEWRDTNADRCDDLDPSLCFRDCNADARYWGMCTAGGKTFPEVPDTGLKKITIRLYRDNKEIASHGFFLIEGGLTGEEMQLTESPLKLEILRPFHSKTYYFFNATPQLIPHLTMVTQRNYPAGFYGYGPNAAGTHALRLDNLAPSISVDQSVSSPAGILAAGAPSSHLNAIGTTEPGARVDFYFRPDGGAMPSNATVPDSSEYADSGGTVNVQAELGTISQKLMVQGRPQFWARAFNRGFFSPFVYRTVCVDATPPKITDYWPRGDHTAGGFSPFIYMSSEDPWIHNYCQNRVYYEYLPAAIITDEGGHSTATWDGKAISYRLSGPSRWNSVAFSRRYYQYLWNTSDRYLPPQLAPGTYTMTYETGDTAMYKTSASWTFNLPASIAADVTPSTITPPSGFAAGDPANLAYYYSNHLTTKAVALGGALAFGRIRFEDPESGIKMNTVRLDCCDDTLTLCHNFYQYFSDGSFGQRFSLSSNYVQLNIYPSHTFSAPTHIANTHRRIRVTANNWAGVPTVIDDWYIQVN